jgi:hypothetical protein
MGRISWRLELPASIRFFFVFLCSINCLFSKLFIFVFLYLRGGDFVGQFGRRVIIRTIEFVLFLVGQHRLNKVIEI